MICKMFNKYMYCPTWNFVQYSKNVKVSYDHAYTTNVKIFCHTELSKYPILAKFTKGQEKSGIRGPTWQFARVFEIEREDDAATLRRLQK